MKKAILTLGAILLSTQMAVAGDYSLHCWSQDGQVKVDVDSLLAPGVGHELPLSLVRLEMPIEPSYASLKFAREFTDGVDFEILGNDSSDFFELSVKNGRFSYRSWNVRNDFETANLSGSIQCVVKDPVGRLTRK
jgi:hypothetical protein